MSNHTQGPWRQGFTLATNVTRRWTQEQWQQNEERERRLVFVNFTARDEGSGRKLIAACESEDDARLIAAAPELLDALKDLVDNGIGTESVKHARAAIAKAKEKE